MISGQVQQRDTAFRVLRVQNVRVKRWGKSPPGLWKHRFYDVNSIRSNAVEEHMVCPTVPRRRLDPGGNPGTR